MLRELLDLSAHFNLQPAGYTLSTALLRINLENYGIELLETSDNKGKKKPGQKFMIPDATGRNGKNAPALLVNDTAEFIWGLGDREERVQKHQRYRELLERCYEATQCELLKLVLDFPPKSIEELRPIYQKFAYKDKIVFAYEGKLITDEPILQDWWAKEFSKSQDTTPGVCCISGNDEQVVRLFPGKIKGVPGTQAAGAALSSFDKDSTCSHSWENNQNAPIGFNTALKALQMLNALLATTTHCYKIGELSFVFWGDTDKEGLNPEFWDDPSAAIARSIFTSPNRPSDLPGSQALSQRFYLAILKGNRGRVALVSFSTTTGQQIAESITRFVELQERTTTKASPVWLLTKAAFFKPEKEHPDPIRRALVQFALFGETLPENYPLRIFRRIWAEEKISVPRLNGLSLFVNEMNQNRIAYRLGRISFLLHQAQMIGQEKKKEDTNVTRALKTLSTAPGTVFGKLYQGAIAHHLENANPEKRGMIVKIKKSLDSEFSQLEVNPDNPDLPDTFSTKEQSLFFLGWGQARADWFASQEQPTNNIDDNNIEIKGEE